MFLAAANGAEGEVFLTVYVIAFTLTGARDKAVGVVGIHRQGEQREAFTGARQLFEFFPRLIEHGVVIEAPVVAIGGIRYRSFELFRPVQVIEAVGFEKHVFAGKAQVGSLHKIVFIAGVFQDIAKADILGKEAGDRGRGVAFKRREQRNAALRGDHTGDGVIRPRELHGIAEIEALIFYFAELRGEVRKGVVIKIGTLEAFAIDIDQVQLWIVDTLRRLFVVCGKVRVTFP
ncbi:unknown [Klebsiella variicola CAG:634]|nr:unknown [Klebsiella variicola CAG:634]